MNYYYGKYRAIVKDVNDPKKMGRARLLIPSILGKERLSNWAIPTYPYFLWFPLEVGMTAWVEFEEGHIDRPLVTGSWWKERETPISEFNSEYEEQINRKRIKTTKGNVIELCDIDGKEIIKFKTFDDKLLIEMDVTSETIKVVSSKKVSVEAKEVIVTSDTIKLGSEDSAQSLVLGEKLVDYLNTKYMHLGNLGLPTKALAPIPTVSVLSQKHKTE